MEYRIRARRSLEKAGQPPRYLRDPGFWEAALAGDLDKEEAWELDAYLVRLLAVVPRC